MLVKKLSRRNFIFINAIVIAMFPFFFLDSPSLYTTPLCSALWNCGHIIFFALAAIIFSQQNKILTLKKFILFSFGIFLIGGLIEIIQAQIGRDADWQDVLRDLTGAWLGLCWIYAPTAYIWCGRIMALLLLIPDGFYVASAAASQLYLSQQFPQLANFESPAELHAWKGNVDLSDKFSTEGHYSLKVHLTTRRYSGVSLNEFFHSWMGFKMLAFDLYNPEKESIKLVLRINDVQHAMGNNDFKDRFNQALDVQAGWNHVEVPIDVIEKAPASRNMDLDHIESLTIFAVQLKTAQDIYLDNIKLK